MNTNFIKKPIPWFLTRAGKTFSFAAVSASSISFGIYHFLPNTIFIDKYIDLVRHYHNGYPVQLKDDLKLRFDKCQDLLKIPESSRKLIKPFSVFGLDLFHAGTTLSHYGSYIGIPVNFTYNSTKDIDKQNIQVNLNKIDWDSEIGQELADALVIPEKVQMFAMCREILSVNNSQILLNTCYASFSIFLTYIAGQNLNIRFNLYSAPKQLRICIYSVLFTFGMGSYFFLKDFTQVKYEAEIDKQLAELGPEFIESGVIFYDKLLKRNRALRELMGNEGKSKYSVMGNENYGLRQPRIALIHRKMFFEELLNKSKNGEPN